MLAVRRVKVEGEQFEQRKVCALHVLRTLRALVGEGPHGVAGKDQEPRHAKRRESEPPESGRPAPATFDDEMV